MVQLSYPYTTTGKTTALTKQTFVQIYVSASKYAVQVCYSFSAKEQASFNFKAADTLHSDSRAQ